MSIAIVQARHIFGLKSGVSGNVCFHDEQTIVYPAGSNCIIYNIDQKSQRFIPSTDKSEGMTALAVSPNRRYVAIAEKGEKPTVTIYDLHSLRKKKALSSNEMSSGEYVSVAFSPDSKYLVTQGGKPDWTLLYWTWEKSKVMASVKSSNPQNPNSEVYQVSFNPQDNTQLCVSGNTVFRFFRYSEGNLKPFNFQKVEPQNYLCHAWVSDDRILVGTDNGHLLLFEAGEVKQEFNLGHSGERSTIDGELDLQVTALVTFSKGFACAFGMGTVYMYEKTEDKDTYRKTREIKIPPDPWNSQDPYLAQKQIFRCLAVSPSEETMVGSTDQGQLYYLTLSGAELGKGDQANFEILSQMFHTSPITGLDVCIRKPLIATCSTDHAVMIWNYETCNLELYKVFPEEAYSIALHPSGLYILVGFNDKLRLMNLLIDDIKPFKEFTVRGCRECAFSNGGHLFASVMGNVIQIYSTTTFENVNNLKGHNGKVKAVVWSADDSKLISCGMDGAVYEWDTFTGKRTNESVWKSCAYTSVTVTPDAKSTFAVGSDRTLKEIADSQILREVPAGDMILTVVALSHSGRMLFAGTVKGTIWSMKYPLAVPGDWTEHHGHGAAVVKMKITYDDQYLVSIGEDASVILWKIQDKEGRGLKRDKEIGWAEEILVTKNDLEEKNSTLADLNSRVEELKMENEYQLRLKDMTYNEKMKELTEKFIQEMESLKTKNQVLKTDKDREEAKHEEDMAELMEMHAKELQDLESANNQKLMLEYEKFQEQQAKTLKIQEDYEKQLAEMEESKEKALEELTVYYETKLQEMKVKLEQRKLREEKEANLRLRGETGIMRKKFTTLQKEIDDHKDEIKKLQAESSKLNNVIRSLEKDIQGLKKEIQERDDTIQDKEKRIYDLKKKNQELEKFKFVLDYKIKELKKQIEPREMDIKNMKEQIQE
ncbi:unnamed protein product, partial [Candidula unifasciata]